MSRRTRRPVAGAASLLAQIHRDPADLAARAVYGDALLEQGDPPGELIALQLERARTGKSPTPSERALVKQHWDRWLGPLVPVLDRRHSAFERGFLHTARLNAYRPAMTADALDHPAWRTVEVLHAIAVTDYPELSHEPAELLARIPTLRVLECDVDDCLGKIAKRVRKHRLDTFVAYLKSERQLRDLLAMLDKGIFPALTHLRTLNYQPPLAQLRTFLKQMPKLASLACLLQPSAPETVRAIDVLVDAVPSFSLLFRFGEARIARVDKRLTLDVVEMRYLADLRPLLDKLGPARAVVGGKLAPKHRAELAAAGFTVAPRARKQTRASA
jgi:uncharacterized protein (TIGR02996 family)